MYEQNIWNISFAALKLTVSLVLGMPPVVQVTALSTSTLRLNVSARP